MSVVDFSREYYMESSTVLSRAPAPASRAFAVFSPFVPTVTRYTLTSMLLPLLALTVTMLRISPSHALLVAAINCLTLQVWALLVGSVLLMGLTLRIVYDLSEGEKKNNRLEKKHLSAYWFTYNTFGIIMNQDDRFLPEGQPLRFLFMTWFLFGYVICGKEKTVMNKTSYI